MSILNDNTEFIQLAGIPKIRYVATDEGAIHYGIPKGSPITKDVEDSKNEQAAKLGIIPPAGSVVDGDAPAPTALPQTKEAKAAAKHAASTAPTAPVVVAPTPVKVSKSSISGNEQFSVGGSKYTAPSGSKLILPTDGAEMAFILTPDSKIHAFSAAGEMSVPSGLGKILATKFSGDFSGDEHYAETPFEATASPYSLSNLSSGDTLTDRAGIAQFKKLADGSWEHIAFGSILSEKDIQPLFDEGKLLPEETKQDKGLQDTFTGTPATNFSELTEEELTAALDAMAEGSQVHTSSDANMVTFTKLPNGEWESDATNESGPSSQLYMLSFMLKPGPAPEDEKKNSEEASTTDAASADAATPAEVKKTEPAPKAEPIPEELQSAVAAGNAILDAQAAAAEAKANGLDEIGAFLSSLAKHTPTPEEKAAAKEKEESEAAAKKASTLPVVGLEGQLYDGPNDTLADEAGSYIMAAHKLPDGMTPPKVAYVESEGSAQNPGEQLAGKHSGGTITLSEKDMNPVETFVHEYGHFLDKNVFGHMAGTGSSQVGTAKFKFWAVVKKAGTFDMIEKKFQDNPKMRNYLSQPKEIFARAYSQWVGLRSGKPEDIYPNWFKWDADQFEPIAAEFDKLFAEKGLSLDAKPVAKATTPQAPTEDWEKALMAGGDTEEKSEGAVGDILSGVADMEALSTGATLSFVKKDGGTSTYTKLKSGDWLTPAGQIIPAQGLKTTAASGKFTIASLGGESSVSTPDTDKNITFEDGGASFTKEEIQEALTALESHSSFQIAYGFKSVPNNPLAQLDTEQLKIWAATAYPDLKAKPGVVQMFKDKLGIKDKKVIADPNAKKINLGSATPKSTATGMTGGEFTQTEIQDAVDILEGFSGKVFKSELSKQNNALGDLNFNDIVGFSKDKSETKQKVIALLKSKLAKNAPETVEAPAATPSATDEITAPDFTNMEIQQTEEWADSLPEGQTLEFKGTDGATDTYTKTGPGGATWLSKEYSSLIQSYNFHNGLVYGQITLPKTPEAPEVTFLTEDEISGLAVGSKILRDGNVWTKLTETHWEDSAGFGLGNQNMVQKTSLKLVLDASAPKSKDDWKILNQSNLEDLAQVSKVEADGTTYTKQRSGMWVPNSVLISTSLSSEALAKKKPTLSTPTTNLTQGMLLDLGVGSKVKLNGDVWKKDKSLYWVNQTGVGTYGPLNMSKETNVSLVEAARFLTPDEITNLKVGSKVLWDSEIWTRKNIQNWVSDDNFGNSNLKMSLRTNVSLVTSAGTTQDNKDSATGPTSINDEMLTKDDLDALAIGDQVYEAPDDGTTEGITYTKTGPNQWSSDTWTGKTVFLDGVVTAVPKADSSGQSGFMSFKEIYDSQDGTVVEVAGAEFTYSIQLGGWENSMAQFIDGSDMPYRTDVKFVSMPSKSPATPSASGAAKMFPGLKELFEEDIPDLEDWTVVASLDGAVLYTKTAYNGWFSYNTQTEEKTGLGETQMEQLAYNKELGLPPIPDTSVQGLLPGRYQSYGEASMVVKEDGTAVYTTASGIKSDMSAFKAKSNHTAGLNLYVGPEKDLTPSEESSSTSDPAASVPMTLIEPAETIDEALSVMPVAKRGKTGDGFVVVQTPKGPKLSWGRYGAGGVASVAVDKDGTKKVLIGKRGDRDEWYLPGGAIDEKESHIQGAFREFMEEVEGGEALMGKFKLVSGHEAVIGKIDGTDKDWKYVTVVADLGEVVDIKAPKSSESWELSEYKWFDAVELKELEKSGKLHRSLTDGALAKMVGFEPGTVDTFDTDFIPAMGPEDLSTPKYNISNWKKIGGQAGSNSGGVYEDENGDKYYVKRPSSLSGAHNEVLASSLYTALGVNNNRVYLGSRNGTANLFLVSPWVENDAKAVPSAIANKDTAFLKKVQADFAIDAWLSNYDVAGNDTWNLVADSKGNPFRIDPGGAMMFRGTGAAKSWWNDEITDIDDMRFGSSKSGSYAKASSVFGSMSEEDVAESAKKLQKITPEQIAQLVASSGFSAAQKADLTSTLTIRREKILKRFKLLSSSAANHPTESYSPKHKAGSSVKIKGTGEVFSVELSTNEVAAGKIAGEYVVFLNDELDDPSAPAVSKEYAFTSNGEQFDTHDEVIIPDPLTGKMIDASVLGADWNNGLVSVQVGAEIVTLDKTNIKKKGADTGSALVLGGNYTEVPVGSKAVLVSTYDPAFLIYVVQDQQGKLTYHYPDGSVYDLNQTYDEIFSNGDSWGVISSEDNTSPVDSDALMDVSEKPIHAGDKVTIVKNNKGGGSNKARVVSFDKASGKVRVMRLDADGLPLLDENGKKKYSILDSKSLRLNIVTAQDSNLPTGVTMSQGDPDNPLFGTSSPKAPVLPKQSAQSPLGPEWLVGAQTAFDEYRVKKSLGQKKLQNSSRWTYFQQAMEGDQSALDFIQSKGYLDSDPSLFTELTSKLVEIKLAYAKLITDHEVSVKIYQQKKKDWIAANGLASYTPIRHEDVLSMSNSEALNWSNKRFAGVASTLTSKATSGLQSQKASSGWQTEIRKLPATLGMTREDVAKHATPSGLKIWDNLKKASDEAGAVGVGWRAIRVVSEDRFVMPDGTRFSSGMDLTSLKGTIQKDHGAMEVVPGSIDHGGKAATFYNVTVDLAIPPEIKGVYTGIAGDGFSHSQEHGFIVQPGMAMYIWDVVPYKGNWKVKASLIPEEVLPFMNNFEGPSDSHNIVTTTEMSA